MASTEIYTIRKKDGRLEHYADVPGAMSGALRIWHAIEEKYLPSLPLDDFQRRLGWTYCSRFLPSKKEHLDELWDLEKDPRLSWQDRILLATNMDYPVIRTEDLPEVADAYEGAEFATDNMRRQAEIFRKIHAEADRTVLGIWKNETSVCSVGDFARTTRRGNYYITEDFYDVMKYLRALRDNNYKIDKQ